MSVIRPRNEHSMSPLLVSQPEAARLLGVSERTVFQLRADGKLPAVKIGAAIRYDVEDIKKYIGAAKIGGAEQSPDRP
jgi:excisionase family DNA binding protein